MTPTQKGKAYGLVGGGITIFILYFFVPTNEAGERTVLITYGIASAIGILSAVLWVYNLKHQKSMINTKMDNFVYTLTGFLFLFSIVESLSAGKLPSP